MNCVVGSIETRTNEIILKTKQNKQKNEKKNKKCCNLIEKRKLNNTFMLQKVKRLSTANLCRNREKNKK